MIKNEIEPFFYLTQNRFDSNHSTIAMHLIENGISEQTANRIQTLLDKDGPFDDIINHLKGFTKAKTEVRDD